MKHIGKIVAVFLVAYVGALTLPYVGHKKVSGNIKKEFQAEDCYGDTKGQERVAYINDNVEALKYRLKMISEAKEEVILSTFDFNADSSRKRCDVRPFRSGRAWCKGESHCGREETAFWT